MEDIKILQEELRTSRSKTRSNIRTKGFYPKSCRPIIRFKLVDLDFSLKLGDIQDIKTPPLFFSIVNDSGATSRRNGRQICDFLSKANFNFKTTAEVGDGDCKTIRDRETRMPLSLRSLAVRTLSRNLIPGYATTKLPRDLETRMPHTLTSLAARILCRILIPGDVTKKLPGGTVATYIPCTLRSSAAGTLYRILNVVRQKGNQGMVDGNERTTYNKDGAMNMVDKMKAEHIISSTQVKPISSGTTPEIDISDRIIRHRCQDTKDIIDVNTSNSTVSSARTEHRRFSDKTEEQETPRPKKRQNFLKKFWKRITRKSKNKTESKIDEENVKTLKKSSKLTSLMCLCQPKTID